MVRAAATAFGVFYGDVDFGKEPVEEFAGGAGAALPVMVVVAPDLCAVAEARHYRDAGDGAYECG